MSAKAIYMVEIWSTSGPIDEDHAYITVEDATSTDDAVNKAYDMFLDPSGEYARDMNSEYATVSMHNKVWMLLDTDEKEVSDN